MYGSLTLFKVVSECIWDLEKLNMVKIENGGSDLGSSQFFLLPKLAQKNILALKVVKSDSKIVILLHKSKSVTHSVSNQKNKGCIKKQKFKILISTISP